MTRCLLICWSICPCVWVICSENHQYAQRQSALHSYRLMQLGRAKLRGHTHLQVDPAWVHLSLFLFVSFTLKVYVRHTGFVFVLWGLINCGAAGNILYHNTIMQCNISIQPLWHPLKIKAMERWPIGTDSVTICTKPVLLQISAIPKELISFLFTVIGNHPIMLGFP